MNKLKAQNVYIEAMSWSYCIHTICGIYLIEFNTNVEHANIPTYAFV